MDIGELVPRNKRDLARAQAIVARGYPDVGPVLPALLEWIQDMNWPVAQVLYPFLAAIGAPLEPHIRHVLATDDDIWKDNVVGLIGENADLKAIFQKELLRLATAPGETDAGVAERARDILDG